MGKSEEIKKTDGRKFNKRLAPKPISQKEKQLIKPTRNTKAKRDRVSSYAVKGIKEEYGSEKEYFKHLANMARKNVTAMKLLMSYAYGTPADITSSGSRNPKRAPQITFNMGNSDTQKTIDITPEDE